MFKERLLIIAIKLGLILALFMPLVFWNDFAFPAITAKAFFFQIIIEVLAFLYLILIIFNSQYRPKFSPLFWALALFFAILTVTALTGLNPYRSFWGSFERMWGIFSLLHFWAFFVLLTAVFKTEKDWRILFNVTVFVGLIAAVISLNQYFHGLAPYSTIANTAFLASYLILNIFLALWLFFRTEKKYLRLIYGLIFLVLIADFLVANSRGAFLGLLAGFGFLIFGFILLLLRGAKRRSNLILIILCALFIFGVGFLFLNREQPWLSQNRYLGHLFQISLKEPTARTRLLAWQFAWEGFKERPILGVGNENFNLVFNKHFQPEFYKYAGGDIWFDRAHNQPLDFLVNAGIFGFLSYLSLFGVAFYILFSKNNLAMKPFNNLILAAGLFAYFVQNFFVFDTQSSFLVFFLVLGYLGFKHVLGKEENHRPAVHKKVWRLVFPIIMMAAFASLIMLIYRLNIRPMFNAYYLSRIYALSNAAQSQENDVLIADAFKKSLPYDTMGKTEVRKNFAGFFVDRALKEIPISVQFLKENLPLAVAGIEQNRRDNPLDIYPLLQLADLQIIDISYLGNLKVADAEKTAQAMIDLNPGRLEGYYLLAQVKYTAGQSDEAVTILKRVLQIIPDDAETHYRLSVAYEGAGRIEESSIELKKAYDLGHNIIKAIDLLKLADIFIKAEDYKTAVSFYEKAVISQPKNLKIAAALAAGYAKIGEYGKARKVANIILQVGSPEYQEQARQFLESIEGK